VFSIRVYGRIYGLIVRVVFMVRGYGICLRDEFTGQAYGPSLFVMFITLSYFLSFVSTFQPILQIRFTNCVSHAEKVSQSYLMGSNFISVCVSCFRFEFAVEFTGLLLGSCL